MKRGALLAVLTFVLVVLVATPAFANVSGAIFTTLPDGSRVNANIYPKKSDVYLDGGPGMGAPSKAAALDPGWYYFQVTDPSGKVLLSEDPAKCRKFRVGEGGFIVEVVTGCTTLKKVKGEWVQVSCDHLTGVDQDYGPYGAITVQLMPFADTPNKGGVYKVWVTPVDKFVGDPNLVDNGYAPGNVHGFVPAWSKTDNFKVKGVPTCVPTEVTVKKFHDLDADGVWDAGEPQLAWAVEVTYPDGSSNVYTTPFTLISGEAGHYTFKELVPDPEGDCDPGWLQTALYLDGVAQPVSDTIRVYLEGCVTGTKTPIRHEIVFGNVRLACAGATKFYDRDADGEWDADEAPIAGWRIALSGTNVRGEAVALTAETDAEGTAHFCGLLPGDYTIEEVMPVGNWVATTPLAHSFHLAPGDCAHYEFGNYCYGTADFNTKGFWHNKNGLELIEPDWIAYVNGLAPYAANPFDGLDEYGNPVPAAKGPAGETIAAEGTALAEISAYLVDSNAGGDPKTQLGQQLLAFIFNVKYNRLTDATIVTPSGPMSGQALINGAVAAWSAGGSAANEWSMLLDGLNNCDAVRYVCSGPCCPIVYPSP